MLKGQGVHTVDETAPLTEEKVIAGQGVGGREGWGQWLPAGHSEQEDAPGREKYPREHGTQVTLDEAPIAELAVPATQGVGIVEFKGQKDPVGH